MDITITITQVDLEKERYKKRTISKSILASEESHTKLKSFASKRGVTVKALIDCIASKLPEIS